MAAISVYAQIQKILVGIGTKRKIPAAVFRLGGVLPNCGYHIVSNLFLHDGGINMNPSSLQVNARLPKGYIVIPSELEIPYCVYNYITKGYEMYRNDIIKEYIDKDYLDEQEYVFRRLSVDEYNYNPVAFTLKKGVEFTKITKEYIESGIFK